MESLIPIIVALGLCLIIGAAIYSYVQAKQRREDLLRLAGELGLAFDAEDPYGLAERFSFFEPLAAGHDRSAYNVVHGQFGAHAVKAFDFIYHTTESSGKSTREESHYFSAVIFEVDVTLPPLLIRPESFFDKVAAALGFDDINFESAEFSRKFYVKSPDKKFAYDVIHPRMMEFLLEHRGWTLHLQGPAVLVHNGTTLEPKVFRSVLEFGDAFLKEFPDFLWQRLREG